MNTDEFRRTGHQVIDWIADYMESGYTGRVSPDTTPGELLKLLPESPPRQGEPAEALLEDFHQLILPRMTHWNDPRFFGYFPCNHSRPGILGDLLSAGLGVNAMSWATSPAATELEIRMMQWLGRIIGLDWPGCIQDTASTATLCALLAARERLNPMNEDGAYGKRRFVCYTSDQAHSSVLKAVRIAGVGGRYLRLIPSDSEFAMRPYALEEAIQQDLQKGLQPGFVTATVGTTSSTGFDPVARLAPICRHHGLWLHVDAAMAGSAAILPEMGWLMEGVDQADSYLFNPHKWLFTNFDCTAFFCRRPRHLKQALAIQPEYLKTRHDAAAENFRDWSLQLGRRFRALKLWFVLRCYGVEGLQQKLRLHLKMARWFAEQVKACPQTSLLLEPRLNTVCFHLDSDERSEALLQSVNQSGQAFLTHTRLNDRYIIRASFGQTHSRVKHAEDLWRLIEERL